ncbi:MAG: dienelactone hydrolase [bacterium]|nr:dienelactone hydrolase [bacterium]
MIDVLLFHHALGLTDGVVAFADELSASGHHVTTPDLYGGARFHSVADGVRHAEAIGFDTLIERGVAYAADIPGHFAVVGFSLGVLPAQKLAQTNANVLAAVLCHSAIPIDVFAHGWPSGVGLQIHLGEDDELVVEDLEAARQLAADAPGELFLYPGPGHLIADVTSADYQPVYAEQILARTRAFLAGLTPRPVDGLSGE